MFNEDINIAKAQKVMLEMLKEVHKICVDNDITYWLDAGTLLGAVRHKGFIPWDDDCDISMSREDYEKFNKIAQSKLPEGMFLQNKDTDPEFPLNFTKIRKLGTKLVEKHETEEENYCQGVFIDIFPYDHYRSRYVIDYVLWHTFARVNRRKYRKGSLQRILVTIYTNIILYLPLKISRVLKNFLINHKELICNKNGLYFTYGIECCPIRRTKVSDIFPVKLEKAVFEGYDFYIPNNYDEVLKSNFGNDYMKLPPIDKRQTHAKKIVV